MRGLRCAHCAGSRTPPGDASSCRWKHWYGPHLGGCADVTHDREQAARATPPVISSMTNAWPGRQIDLIPRRA